MADVQVSDVGTRMVDYRTTANVADDVARRQIEEAVLRLMESRMQLLDPQRGFEVR